MKKNHNRWVAGAILLALAGTAAASPVLMQGDSAYVNVTDRGVFSSLRYDPAGGGNFPANMDYVSPGTPFEGFAVEASLATGGVINYSNSNSGGASIAGTTSVATGAFDYGALWSGTSTYFDISHLFFFNEEDARINITTTITAKADLSNLRVSRAVDPDPDSLSYGTSSTKNQRGIAGQGISTADFVGAVGSVSGYPLGLFYSGPITHNTGIVSYCCGVTDVDTYLGGGELGDSSVGDHGIGIGFLLGSLLSGQSVSWSYAYVMGGSLDTVDIPDEGGPVEVPEPGTLGLLGAALAGLCLSRRRKVHG